MSVEKSTIYKCNESLCCIRLYKAHIYKHTVTIVILKRVSVFSIKLVTVQSALTFIQDRRVNRCLTHQGSVSGLQMARIQTHTHRRNCPLNSCSVLHHTHARCWSIHPHLRNFIAIYTLKYTLLRMIKSSCYFGPAWQGKRKIL